jgi:hypothetical protein
MKIRILFSACLFAALLLVLSACSAIVTVKDSGQLQDRSYDFQNFSGIEINSAIKYDITRSDNYSVKITTHENLVDRLDVHQNGDIIYIRIKPGVFNTGGTRAVLTLPQLNHLTISGSSDGKLSGFDSRLDLDIKVSGASRLDAKLKAGKTRLEASGSSDIRGDLTTDGLTLALSGASSCDANLRTAEAYINASGSSNVRGTLQARNININLTGASKLELSGSAADAALKVSGSSDLVALELVLQNADVDLSSASTADLQIDGRLNITLSGSSTLKYEGKAVIGSLKVDGSSKVTQLK